jgi:hypothetical protein
VRGTGGRNAYKGGIFFCVWKGGESMGKEMRMRGVCSKVLVVLDIGRMCIRAWKMYKHRTIFHTRSKAGNRIRAIIS